MVTTWPMSSSPDAKATRQNLELTSVLRSERSRLWSYIRRRVTDDADAEDVLQEVFGELVEAYRALLPIERIGSWLVRVARNRLIDRSRARRPESSVPFEGERQSVEGPSSWEELLPDPDAGPEAAYERSLLLEELERALAQLPREQREVFVAHEFEGESFAAMAARTGVGVNTLLGRKHYAVRQLRDRLSALRDDFRNESGD
jgi:RNA polymerase sigma factor (sigma-70 family)